MISPGLAYSYTAMFNLLGCRVKGLPLVIKMWYLLSLRELIGLSQLIPAKRPSLAVTHWQIKLRTDKFNLEIFQEAAYSVQLSFLSYCSDQDSPGEMSLTNPIYYKGLYFQCHCQ